MSNCNVGRITRLAFALGLAVAAASGEHSPAAATQSGGSYDPPAAVHRATDEGKKWSGAVLDFLPGDGSDVRDVEQDRRDPRPCEKTFTFALSCFRVPLVSLTITIRKPEAKGDEASAGVGGAAPEMTPESDRLAGKQRRPSGSDGSEMD